MKSLGRRDFLKNFSLGLAAVTAAPYMSIAKEERQSQPNIIMLMADDLGYGDVGFRGNKIIKTPNLDEMAKHSLEFTRFFAGCPVCSPTRATCLTGRHYFRYGIFSASVGYLPAEEITIASMCKSKGYTTGHFGKWHIASMSKTGLTMPEYKENRLRKYGPPWERDYDESFATECNVPTFNPGQTEGQKWVFTLPFWHNGKIESENLEGPSSKVLMDRAIPFIKKAAAEDKPFFTTIWFHEPHEPVVAGPKYRAMYKQYDEPEQHYYGCITAMDEQIGRLRKELRDLGIAKNTLIWFYSDNGPEGMDGKGNPKWCFRSRGVTGGLRGRKRSLFAGGVQGPALLEWPGKVKGGSKTNITCSTLDYFPTIRELIGYKMPDQRPIDGVSLLPMLAGEIKRRPRPIPFWFIRPSKEAMHGSPTIGVVDNNLKLLTNFSVDGSEDIFFDLDKDPYEENNIIADNRRQAETLKAWLRDWVRSCKVSHSGGDYPTDFTPVNKFPEITGTWRK